METVIDAERGHIQPFPQIRLCPFELGEHASLIVMSYERSSERGGEG